MSEEVKNTDYVLEVENLHTCFHTESGDVNAVNGLSMTLEAGKTLGIVGESGSGKSVTAYSIMQILAETGEITVRILQSGVKENCIISAVLSVLLFSRTR